MIIDNLESKSSEEILREWEAIKDKKTDAEKFSFLKEIINTPFVFIKCHTIFWDLLIELASSSEEFLEILNLVASKLTLDLVYSNMILPLIQIGREKAEDTQGILDQIYRDPSNYRLIALSGHLLGGLYQNKPKEFLDIVERQIDTRNEYFLVSYIKALRIILDAKGILSEREKLFLDRSLKKGFEIVNTEIIFLLIENIKQNREFCYKRLERLIQEEPVSYKRALFNQFNNFSNFEEEDVFSLIELSKSTDDSVVLTSIAGVFCNYPHQARDIIHIVFYWIREGTILSIMNIDWFLQEYARKNPEISRHYLIEYKEYCAEIGIPLEPFFFENFITQNVEEMISFIMGLDIQSKLDDYLQLLLFKKILGYCYKDLKYYPLLQKMMVFLVQRYGTLPYFENPITEEMLENRSINPDQYYSYVDRFADFFETVESYRDDYDFEFILEEIKKYPTIHHFSQDLLEKSKNERTFSPLLNLIQPTYDMNSTNKMDLYDIAWGKAWLNELETGLNHFLRIPNKKYSDDTKKFNFILSKLSHSREFWAFLSEILIINRIKPDNISEKDTSDNGEADIDFLIILDNKRIFLEITSVEMPRDLRISNGATILKSKSYSAIDQKYKQIKKSGHAKCIEESEDCYYYIIIDEGQYPSRGQDIIEALFGPLTLTIFHDKETREYRGSRAYHDSSKGILVKNRNAKIISGIMFFKAVVNPDTQPFPTIELNGNIINNPNGKNLLPEPTLDELKGSIFKNIIEERLI